MEDYCISKAKDSARKTTVLVRPRIDSARMTTVLVRPRIVRGRLLY